VKILVKQAAHSQYLGLTSTDSVSTFLSAGKQSPPWGPAHVAEGQSVTVPFRLSEFINPSSITSASTLSIWAGSSEENYETLGDFLELPYPFLSGGEISVHAPDNQTGIYTITVDMA
jgi:hypothetical protein